MTGWCAGAAFHFENLAHSRRIGSIGSRSIDRLGRKYHQIAGATTSNSLLDFGLC